MYKIASVIIPTYRKFDYIFNAIDSVIKQDYSNIEIIVSDDGSEDFPSKKINNYIYTNKRNNISSVLVYSNSENLGTVKNLNNAIKKSNGDYIIILSNDDELYSSNTISLIVKRLIDSREGVIVCRRVMCDEKLTPIRYMPTHGHIKKINKIIKQNKQHSAFLCDEHYEMASGSCTYYTREKIFSDGLFDEKYVLLEDWTHFIRITRKSNIETAYDIVSIFYRTGGISSSRSQAIIQDYLKALDDEMENNCNYISKRDLRFIKYNCLRFGEKKSFLANAINPDLFLSKLFYKIRCYYFSKKGIEELKQ